MILKLVLFDQTLVYVQRYAASLDKMPAIIRETQREGYELERNTNLRKANSCESDGLNSLPENILKVFHFSVAILV